MTITTARTKIKGETHLHAIRFSQSNDDTLSLLFLDGKFECFILEDEEREVKVPGKTRIPEGTYEVKLRKDASPMNDSYSEKYPELHKGMLWLQDVPGFEWIYIHIGNKHEHTDGCLLTGDSLSSNVEDAGGVGYVGSSGKAYKRLYAKVLEVMEKGNKVWITVSQDIPLPVPNTSDTKKNSKDKEQTD